MCGKAKSRCSATAERHIREPDKWEAYPVVERSTITRCDWQNLSSDTKINRSTLKDVVVLSSAEATSKKSQGDTGNAAAWNRITAARNEKSIISRSTVTSSRIQASLIERSDLKKSNVIYAGVSRSYINEAKVTGISPANEIHLNQDEQVHISRSTVQSSELSYKCTVSRSTIQSSLGANFEAERSTIQNSYVTNSLIERSNLSKCDVEDCIIRRTDFTGKFVRNGKWDRGNLVGRLDETKEVVVRDIEPGSARQVAVASLPGLRTPEAMARNFISGLLNEKQPPPPSPSTTTALSSSDITPNQTLHISMTQQHHHHGSPQEYGLIDTVRKQQMMDEKRVATSTGGGGLVLNGPAGEGSSSSAGGGESSHMVGDVSPPPYVP